MLLFSAILLTSFAFKTGVCLEKKWSILFVDVDDEQANEEESTTKNESKSYKPSRKVWYFQWSTHQHYLINDNSGQKAHDSIYLLAIISEPLMTILIQPPEIS